MALSIPQMARMSQLLDEALPLDSAGRRAWLENLSLEHRDLAPALRKALLPDKARAANLQAKMTLPELDGIDAATTGTPSGLEPGAPVGPYELLRLLGAGGMAEVWLARRADGAFTREVALKLPLLTRLQAGLEARFARERDILGTLEHPHIARLYDAGVDSEGLPYLAMEYVQGEQLTTWCESHRLGIPERLALLLQVLEAVQYAHERQIVHRDLKPSNILVTESGQVRLLDFGIARLLESEETGQVALTSVYGRALTPDYASPELLRGDPVDARSDLYSLGVLLYDLLTGTQPYRLKRAASIGALEQAIATLEVKKPSMQLEQTTTATRPSTTQASARQLRGDLDAIALKALAKEPTQRYPNAAALAEDLRRYLNGRPIQARPARIAYRLQKFVRRNRALVGVTAAALGLVLTMMGYANHRQNAAQVTVTAGAVQTPISLPRSPQSVAVLPFLDLSENRDQEYFSDGLPEELLDMLAKIPGLHVIARTSSFSFKGKSDDIRTIGSALNVANILEGSVRKSGNRVRVSTQLVRADTGENLWSETYDREQQDVFEVQDEIAQSVVGALKVRLLPTEHIAPTYRTGNIDAYNQYLLARQFYGLHSLDGYLRAAAAYRRAIELDRNFAAAYAGLSIADFWIADQTGDATAYQPALAAADRAVALAPQAADGYTARAFLRSHLTQDWTGAQADLAKALTLDSGSSAVQIGYGDLLASLGRLPEAIAAQEKGVELDPLSSGAWNFLGVYLTANQDLAAARKPLMRALEISPGSEFALSNLAVLDLLSGEASAALAAAHQIRSSEWRLFSLALSEYSLGHTKESEQALQELISKHGHDSAYQVAEVYAWRGESDQAFK